MSPVHAELAPCALKLLAVKAPVTPGPSQAIVREADAPGRVSNFAFVCA